MKKVLLFLLIFTILFVSSCNDKEDEHVCHIFKEETSDINNIECGEPYEVYKVCVECGKKEFLRNEVKEHDFITETLSSSCGKDGYIKKYCKNCDLVDSLTILPASSDHNYSEERSTYSSTLTCGETYDIYQICLNCGDKKIIRTETINHQLTIERLKPTCHDDGYEKKYCIYCDYVEYNNILKATNDHQYEETIITEASGLNPGTHGLKCIKCGDISSSSSYYSNGLYVHGKLSVNGPDLVDQNGDKFQLVGLSTHGLQWFGKYVNLNTFRGIHNEFVNNVFRLSLYTSENGYCECSESRKQQLYNTVVNGIKAATELDCYVIVDWHMLGAENANDKNPLYYMEEAKEFFGKISLEFKDYNNVLYEIMNEPSGSTTWQDCKTYAETIIPIIRQNTDSIILVGNPKWSADLESVMKNPLVGYSNIMYTFHFYANDSFNQKKLTNAYDAGFPVFVTEHGGMEASGDGAIDYTSVKKWYTEMDKRNISYVAWNISNSKGSASIIKYNDSTMTDFSDTHLKEWGIYYKTVTRGRLEED